MLTGAAVLACFLWWYQSFAVPAQIRFYTQALASARAYEAVTVAHITYLVSGGMVSRGGAAVTGTDVLPPLRLAYEKTAARRAPLLALPGTDPSALARAADLLSDTRDRLASFQKNARDQALVTRALYPLDFLRAAAALEQARLTFLENGDDVSAQAYRSQSLSTAAAYLRDLRAFKVAFSEAVPPETPPYATAESYVTRAATLELADTLYTGVDTVRGRLQQRFRCFDGYQMFCRPEDVAYASLQPSMPVAAAEAPDGVRSIWERVFGAELADERKLVLSQPRCTQDMPGAPVFLLRNETSLSTHYRQPVYLGDIRFIDANTHKAVPFYNFFIEHGHRFVPTSGIYYYQCPELVHDAGTLLAMEALADEYAAGTTQALREQDMRTWVAHERDAAARGDTSYTEAYQAAADAVMLRNNSAGYDNQILGIAATESANAALAARDVPVGIALPQLFYTRNGLTTLFMAGNPSFGTDLPRFFAPVTLTAQQQPFVYYRTFNPAEQAQALDDLLYFFSIHAQPSRLTP